ncbi:hypothetical protein NUW54_g6367 [Trametes sanguinea]|uniref:Uncharacterized protein n=1 Tax=Trametes sanguinea TaxID=158606 RepID=A0ACC1PSI5_9APHY|nr:hypothetical protein NUW54_g6367 [Trametes sanguinea]
MTLPPSHTQSGYAIYPYWLCGDLGQDSYTLIASHFNPEALILEFCNSSSHALYLDIRLLLHVSVQIFTYEEWHGSICKVPRERRGFKVALALDLGPYFLAFLSHDLLFQLHWATEIEHLPSSRFSDVLCDWPGFLRQVATWIEQRRARARRRDSPAFLAIHNADVFPGLGNYTLSEVFHRAGKDPSGSYTSLLLIECPFSKFQGLRLSLTEQEVFDNASRTARLCAAYREFALHTEKALWPFMKRFLHGFKLVVERSDRLLYSKSLKVYGKEWAFVSARHGTLLDSAIATANDKKGPIYDVFEPSLIANSLSMTSHNLGHLIFGPVEWDTLQRSWQVHVDQTSQDALTKLYRAFLYNQRTYLRPGYYHDGLGVTQWNARRFATTMYRLSPSRMAFAQSLSDTEDDDEDEDEERPQPKRKKVRTYQAWTVIPSVMHRASQSVQERMMQVPDAKRLLTTLACKIKTTRTYTVGPLDFCGVARLERAQGRGEPITLALPSTFLCDDDPQVPEYYRDRRQHKEAHLKSHFTAALRMRHVRRWNTRRKKGPSHKRDPNSTRTRRSPTTAEQLALSEGLALIKDLPPRRRRM